jgi:ferredoxin
MLRRRLLSRALYPRRQNTPLHELARSLSSDKNHSVEIASYLETLAIDVTLHKGIIKAFESMHGKDVRVDVMQSFGEEGMNALAASVEQEQAKRRGHGKRPSTDVLIKTPHHKTDFKLKWKTGDSLLDLAQENEELLGEYMEGTCGGNMSCCTCHIYVKQPEFRELLPDPEESELDMLDLAYEPKDSSRLGCQVRLTPIIMGAPIQLEFTIPAGVNNVWNYE